MAKRGTNADWQSGKEFADTNLHMLESSIGCDVTFRVGLEETKVHAHKFMMISRSHVFSTMFCGGFTKTGDISISNTDVTTFKQFLRFIYTNDITIEYDNVVCMLNLAKRYSIGKLQDVCVKFLDISTTSDNVCHILSQAGCHDEMDVHNQCLHFINQNAKDVLASPGFLDLSQKSVFDIVKSDDLDIDEEAVFRAVDKWAENTCQKQGLAVTSQAKRDVLGSVTNQVRFCLLSKQFVANTVNVSGYLTQKEELTILQHFLSPKTHTFPGELSAKPRNRIPIYRRLNLRTFHRKCFGLVHFRSAKFWKLILGFFIAIYIVVTLSYLTGNLNRRDMTGNVFLRKGFNFKGVKIRIEDVKEDWYLVSVTASLFDDKRHIATLEKFERRQLNVVHVVWLELPEAVVIQESTKHTIFVVVDLYGFEDIFLNFFKLFDNNPIPKAWDIESIKLLSN
ncbi:BTB/POZ domain-containing protein 2-like [Gigantopelta aegis]|uniref:BTB/POZ domain-containing protein 2-like n=1 Tax=Gigantopelta aegis TaxID=1735272 RepID=UPI001B888ED0|nr:BTB/POZ domain-containing protein 2-like [Gigantopelta aegis]XP_041375869.1 BTB/POZ domain-containing protein 2-like [Gigantopelta aegis]XP_041375870.1 BTB/POZ domain-containing protein 2-like [Gigantopelta aegis]